MNAPMSPEDAAKFMSQLNQLRSDVLLFIVVITTLAGVYLIVSKLILARREKQAEEAKNERAKLYRETQERQAAAIENLAQAMLQHTGRDATMANQLNTTMNTVCDVTGNLKTAIELLVAKNEGKINRNDSIKMIRDRFIQNVYREFATVIEVSLRENDYENRKAHVTRKVKTELGRILIEARRYLASFNLSVDPRAFFQLVPADDGRERFWLCDAVWDEIESLFLREHCNAAKLKQVTEEAYVIIENVIKDYVTRCAPNGDCHIDFRKEPLAAESSAALLMKQTTRLLDRDVRETGTFPPLRPSMG